MKWGGDLNFGISNVHAFENILSGAFHSTLLYDVLKKKQPVACRKCFHQLYRCWGQGGQLVVQFWSYLHLAAPQPFCNNSASTSITSLMQEGFRATVGDNWVNERCKVNFLGNSERVRLLKLVYVFEKSVGSVVFSYLLTACVIGLPKPFLEEATQDWGCREVYASAWYSYQKQNTLYACVLCC